MCGYPMLAVVADDTSVNVEALTARTAEHYHAFATTGDVRFAFNRDEPVITEIFNKSGMTIVALKAHHKDQARLYK